MDSGVKKFNPISDSESESAFSISNKKVKSIGLMPRKDNHRACKGKRTNIIVSTSSTCSKPIPSPIIDNTGGGSRNSSVGDEMKEKKTSPGQVFQLQSLIIKIFRRFS